MVGAGMALKVAKFSIKKICGGLWPPPYGSVVMKFKDMMRLFTGQQDESPDVSDDLVKLEGQEALRALDVVGCVEVSNDVAKELGAFDESALSLDDVLDDEH